MTASTAARIIRPVSQVEDLRPQQNEPFPEGAWQGTIEEVRTRTLDFLQSRTPEQITRQGYTSPDVTVFSLQIGNNRSLQDADGVGNRKFFTPDIVLQDGDWSVEDFEFPADAWQLRRSQNVLTNLAIALGQAERVETDQGPSYAVAEGFLTALLDEQFDGSDVGFIVYHRPWTSKNGKSGTEELVQTFTSPVL